MKLRRTASSLSLLLAVSAGCADASSKSDADYERDVVDGMHESLLADIEDLRQAVSDVQAAAPAEGRGWDPSEDAAAIAKMRDAWKRARTAYEHIEGAIAPLFSEIDFSIDARYDDYLADVGPDGDQNLFDDKGVTGLHGVERILWSDTIPANVVAFEASLPGYKRAAFPATAQEASDFKTKLCARMVADAKSLEEQWTPAKIDLAAAFMGLISLMNEQREKVNKAATNEEESRYSQRTMSDIRDNLEGTRKIYELFGAWLVTKENAGAKGEDIDARITRGFDTLEAMYAQVKGDAIPAPPASWSSEQPSAKDLATPFGKLYEGVHDAVEPASKASIVSSMNDAASMLGFEELRQE